MNIRCVCAAEAQLGEGPLWDASRGILWWVDIRSATLHAHQVATGTNHHQRLPWRLTALGLASDGGLVAVGDPGFVRLSVTGHLGVALQESLVAVREAPGNRFNDGKVDAAGRFWAGTMHDAEQRACGCLYRFDGRGQYTAVRSDMGVPNGPCFFADGTMLITDSATRTISALTMDSQGAPVKERRFAQFSARQGSPDGMTVDADDHVWIAFWDGWCVRRLTREGEIVAEVALPVQRPTSLAFGGAALDQLFITTARTGLTPGQLRDQPLAGSLLVMQPVARGIAPATFTDR